MTKSFTTAAASKILDETGAEVNDNLTFDLDDVTYEIRRPKSAQIALILASSSDTAKDDTGAVATFINVFFSLLVDEGETLLKRRLMDSEDAFEIEDISDILFWLIEEGGARPTRSSSGSSRSPSRSGGRSTAPARRRASTRSPSPSTDS